MTAIQSDASVMDLARFYLGDIPHIRELGMELVEVGCGDATMRLPYRSDLVGDPDTGVLHGGAVTVLIDSVCGLSVLSAMRNPGPIATLDLRIDYLKPATPNEDLLAEAHAYKVTNNIAFIRASAWHSDPEDAVAFCVCTFMKNTKGPDFSSSKVRDLAK